MESLSAAETVETYVPIRNSLNAFNFTYVNNQTSKHYDVDLKKEIEDHCQLLINVLDKVYDKSIITLFQGQQKKLEEHKEILNKLRKTDD